MNMKKTAYLDTNTLHFIGIYLEKAKRDNLYPFKTESPDESVEHLKQILSDKKLKNRLLQGLRTLDYLKKHDLQVEYSIVSKIELITGRTRGKAIEYAAQESIPDRMWSRRFAESEIRERVSSADMNSISERIDMIFSNIEESNITVLSNEPHVQDVLDLAGDISGLIYMGAIDCIIYAGALVARTDYLITSDEYFRETVNRIRKPPAQSDYPYPEIQKRLKTLLDPPPNPLKPIENFPEAFMVAADGTIIR